MLKCIPQQQSTTECHFSYGSNGFHRFKENRHEMSITYFFLLILVPVSKLLVFVVLEPASVIIDTDIVMITNEGLKMDEDGAEGERKKKL